VEKLSKDDIEHIGNNKKAILEEVFALTYHTSMTFLDVWNMPISMRKWFLTRLVEQKEAEAPKEQQTQSPFKRPV